VISLTPSNSVTRPKKERRVRVRLWLIFFDRPNT
jgi:hypothetical protein